MNYPLAALRWLDRNAERTLILFAYSGMALIIVVAVVERYVFKTQIPWSSSIPIYLFLWVTWIGCSYNVKQRSHLCFNEVRARLPYDWQFACLVLDTALWVGFGAMVTYYTAVQTGLTYRNFAIVQGTDHVMQWWFYMATPLAWTLLIFRALQNLLADLRRYVKREPFMLDVTGFGAAKGA